MSLSKKLIFIISFVSIFIAIMSTLSTSLFTFSQMEEDVLRKVQSDLESKRTIVSTRITDYFETIQKQVITKANDVAIIEAAHEFSNSFNTYPTTSSDSLMGYYNGDFKTSFDANNQNSVNTSDLYTPLSDITVALQTKLIADNIYPLGEKEKLTALNDNTDYDKAHQRYHPSIRKFLNEFGYYDIFIVEPDSGHIVYSVYKEIDYATSLLTGPYKNSGIAEAFNAALSLKSGDTYLTDFKPYLPSYNNAASFISSPIYDNGNLIGVLIFQMPIDSINDVMTQSGKWSASGFGKSGEVYLVGQDSKLRSDSRFFLEDKQSYLAAIKRKSNNEAIEMESKNTSISIQTVNSSGANAALNGTTGFDVYNDYRELAVLSSYAPLNVVGLNWAIMSEIQEVEALKGVNLLEDKIIYMTFVIVVIVAIVSVIISYVLANYLIRPLKTLSDRFSDLSHGEADLTVRVEDSGIPEVDKISHGFNEFIKQLNSVIANVKDAVNTIATSGTELSVTTEQSNQSIVNQSERVTNVYNSLESFVLSVNHITTQTETAFEATTAAQESAAQSAKNAEIASHNIQELVKEVDNSANVIKELKSHVEDISNVLGVITSIADQTNLLALNAAIEAARAGEHGRGFAVVADEVRTLAARTQESTVTIQSEIALLNDATNKSVESMDLASSTATTGIEIVESVSQTLNELSNTMSNVLSLNGEISNESRQQSQDIETITHHIHDIKDESDQISQASTSMTGVAQELSGISESVNLDMKRFIV